MFNSKEKHKETKCWSSWTKRPRKLLLWLALVLQLLIIGGLWLLQIMHTYQTPLVDDILQSQIQYHHNHLQQQQEAGVNFITSVAQNTKIHLADSGELIIKYNINTFEKDFNQARCFIAGTQIAADDNEATQCVCRPEWHGRDCAQPEAIWRALMTTRHSNLKLRAHPAPKATPLIYIIQGNFLNILLLELQIEAVRHVVDYFIIYYHNNHNPNHNDDNNSNYKLLRRNLQHFFVNRTSNYVLLQCPHDHHNCHNHLLQQQAEGSSAFKIKPTDACVVSDDRTILSRQVLKFYKYYANNNMTTDIWRFRLKHNVYGFFWQHPQQTQLAGVLTTCARFLNLSTNNNWPLLATQDQLIVGDLNHFGGWYCEFCQQPNEIITQLLVQADSSNNNNTRDLPHLNKDMHAEDFQGFISHGIYVDGKLQLVKMRRNVDKYFAPSAAANNTMGKYSNFILNMYESLDDDLFDDDYINGL